MAYGEKFYHSYCNSFGVACKVSILQNDYVGAATELEGQSVPFVKTYESTSDFKFDPIRPSTGEVRLAFGTGNDIEFEDFWTADEREFKVEHFINSALDWVGYVIPNGFQHELRGGIYFGSLLAADGLSTLENIPFAYNDGEPYGTQDLTYNNGFEFPWVLIATEILRKLDLDLNTWTAVDVYERNMTKTGDTRDADPLATSFANVKTYINDTQRKDIPYWRDANEVMNCHEVLTNLCYVFGAKVYQNKGVWRIKRINVDADYGSGDTQRYWRKYNTLAVYLGREAVNNQITLPCATVEAAMIGNNHLVAMDRVFGAFRINYKFQLIRTGDNPISLLPNGDFSDWDNSSKLAAPTGWFRWRDGNNWHMKIKPVDISAEAPGGYTTGMIPGMQDPAQPDSKLDSASRRWNSVRNTDPIGVTKGDILYFSFWAKFQGFVPNNNAFAPIFRIMLQGDNGQDYFLQNVTEITKGSFSKFGWVKDKTDSGTKGDVFFITPSVLQNNGDYETDNDQYIWREFKLQFDEVPESGNIIFDLHGLVKQTGKSTDNYPKFLTNWVVNPKDSYTHFFPVKDFIDEGGPVPRMIITGVELGKIPDPDEFAETQDFIYENPGNYSLEVEPIEILNGDVLDPQHISRIIVPANDTEGKNFWDTIDDKYGPSSLGLITCKSIMNLYIEPFRLIDGAIKAQYIDIDTRIEFEALPGRFFCIQRGSFNEKYNYLEDVTFYEISNVDIAPGGKEGENSILPIYVLSGRQRCQKDGGGLNTGYLEFEYVNMNPNNDEYGSNYWIHLFTTNLDYCPIGQPDYYLWCTDDASLDEANLTNGPFFIDEDDPKSISVSYNNPGGEYIYFVHLALLGVVESISTEAQNEIISDFQYLSDITIDGYLYRVLRQNYVTTEFEGFTINFIFE